MLYLIGLGMNLESISKSGLESIKKCGKVYLELYTVEFPYSKEELEISLGKSILDADRNLVESQKIVEESRSEDVALLIYGSPLMATTHISLIEEARKENIGVKIIHNASVFDAVAETGLQFYKFGKTASMPNFEANSYIDILKKNQEINAHTLILIDIGMKFSEAIERFEKDSQDKGITLKKIIVCSRLGNEDSGIYYGSIEELKDKKVKAPFCLVVPGKLHFTEEEFLKNY